MSLTVDHGVDLVLPKEVVMKGAIHLASILGRCELLHMRSEDFC
jgi:hypothetical protein